MRPQLDLFSARHEAEVSKDQLPNGFRYRTELISAAEESALLVHFPQLPLKEFEFHGYTGKRRVASYGWRYDFAARRVDKAEMIPPFLLPLREQAAAFAGVAPRALQQVLVTEYQPGAGIGWHKDKAVFGIVIGVSFVAPCTFRLRRRVGDSWERAKITVEPRSAYLLSGEARTEWEHSIPSVPSLRYSVTFRNMREDLAAASIDPNE